MRNKNRNRNTFYNDCNYYFGFDGSRNDAPVLVTENKEVVPLENPNLLLASKNLGLFQGFADDTFANAIGDRLKSNTKKIGGQITSAVKDTIKNPEKAVKNLKGEIQKGASNLKDDIKDLGGKGLDLGKKIGDKGFDFGKKVYLAVPRQAFLGLVALNFQGLATRFNNKTDESKKKILDKWDRWGGDKGSLEGSVNTGSKKKPLFISKKKKAQFIAQYNAKNKSFDGDFSYPFGVDEVGELVISSTPTLISFMPMFKQEPSKDPQVDKDIDAGEEAEDKKDGALTIDEANAQNELWKKQFQDIKNNPNLTDADKETLIRELGKLGVTEESFFDKYKWQLIGGLAVVGILIYVLKEKQQ